MKYILSAQRILENVSQAKAILRKNNIEQDDERYLAILDKTMKDGYTGIITKLVFSDNVELDEALGLYDDLKRNKVDLGKLSKKSYDEILDIVYEEDTEQDSTSELQFLFNMHDYKVYHVKTYEAGLRINSPAWCLKTKRYWDDYKRQGENFVLINKNYIKSNKILLATPNTYFGDEYTNDKKPSVRYGLTVNNKNVLFFDDDNQTSFGSPSQDIQDIVAEIRNKVDLSQFGSKPIEDHEHGYIAHPQPEAALPRRHRERLGNLDEVKTLYENIFGDIGSDNYTPNDGIYEFTDDDIKEAIGIFFTSDDFYITDGNFSQSFSYLFQDDEKLENIDDILDWEIPTRGFTIKEFMLENKDYFLGNTNFTQDNGGLDILLYKVYGSSEHDLGGWLLREMQAEDLWIKYSYGVHKTYWGKKMVLQSYPNVIEYLEELVSNFEEGLSMYVSYGDIQPFIESEVKDDVFQMVINVEKYYNATKEDDETNDTLQMKIEDINSSMSSYMGIKEEDVEVLQDDEGLAIIRVDMYDTLEEEGEDEIEE